jgi:hypothetical protein
LIAMPFVILAGVLSLSTALPAIGGSRDVCRDCAEKYYVMAAALCMAGLALGWLAWLLSR